MGQVHPTSPHHDGSIPVRRENRRRKCRCTASGIDPTSACPRRSKLLTVSNTLECAVRAVRAFPGRKPSVLRPCFLFVTYRYPNFWSWGLTALTRGHSEGEWRGLSTSSR